MVEAYTVPSRRTLDMGSCALTVHSAVVHWNEPDMRIDRRCDRPAHVLAPPRRVRAESPGSSTISNRSSTTTVPSRRAVSADRVKCGDMMYVLASVRMLRTMMWVPAATDMRPGYCSTSQSSSRDNSSGSGVSVCVDVRSRLSMRSKPRPPSLMYTVPAAPPLLSVYALPLASRSILSLRPLASTHTAMRPPEPPPPRQPDP